MFFHDFSFLFGNLKLQKITLKNNLRIILDQQQHFTANSYFTG